LDHRVGAGAAATLTIAFLDGTARLLLAGSCEAGLVGAVCRVATGARELAGYQAVDCGADGLAQRQYLQAPALTRRISDRVFEGYLLGVSLGHLALHCGFPERGYALRRSR
jgi:hypothetical protein